MIETYEDILGEHVHMKNGQVIGVSRPGFVPGRTDHYDASGNFAGFSEPGIVFDRVHHDSTGVRVGASLDLPFGTVSSGDFGTALTTETLDGFVTDLCDDPFFLDY